MLGPAPKKRNGQSTWGLPRHMGGVRQSAQCPYGAAEPSWAMVRCYSRSHPPIQYTACVGLSLIFYKVTVGKKEKRWRLTFAECLQAEICPVAWGLNEAARRVALVWHPENKPRQRRCSDDRPTRVGDVGEAPGSLGTAGADSLIPAGRRPRQRRG